MIVDGACSRIALMAPHLVEQLISRDHLAQASGQQSQDTELLT